MKSLGDRWLVIGLIAVVVVALVLVAVVPLFDGYFGPMHAPPGVQ